MSEVYRFGKLEDKLYRSCSLCRHKEPSFRILSHLDFGFREHKSIVLSRVVPHYL